MLTVGLMILEIRFQDMWHYSITFFLVFAFQKLSSWIVGCFISSKLMIASKDPPGSFQQISNNKSIYSSWFFCFLIGCITSLSSVWSHFLTPFMYLGMLIGLGKLPKLNFDFSSTHRKALISFVKRSSNEISGSP